MVDDVAVLEVLVKLKPQHHVAGRAAAIHNLRHRDALAPAQLTPVEDHLPDLLDSNRQLAELPDVVVLDVGEPALLPHQLLAHQQLAGRASAERQQANAGERPSHLAEARRAGGGAYDASSRGSASPGSPS